MPKGCIKKEKGFPSKFGEQRVRNSTFSWRPFQCDCCFLIRIILAWQATERTTKKRAAI
jgi:hypothetical protein